MIANGACLADILERLCETIDAQASNIKSVFSDAKMMDTDGVHLRPAAAPRLPKGWVEAITPLKIGPCVGSCGTAASLKQRVIVSDIATDPLWADYRDLALSYGLRAAWSQPLLSKNNEVLGTFCLYYLEPRSANDTDLQLIEGADHIAVMTAIEGERSQEALRSASEEIRNSEAETAEDHRHDPDTRTGVPFAGWLREIILEPAMARNIRAYLLKCCSAAGAGRMPFTRKTLKKITDKWLGDLAAGQPRAKSRVGCVDLTEWYRWFLFRAERAARQIDRATLSTGMERILTSMTSSSAEAKTASG